MTKAWRDRAGLVKTLSAVRVPCGHWRLWWQISGNDAPFATTQQTTGPVQLLQVRSLAYGHTAGMITGLPHQFAVQ